MKKHLQGPVLHLGCGLDNRFQRLDNGQVIWYDLDFSDVIELLGQFFEQQERCRMIAASLADPDWIEQVSPRVCQALVIAERLLMYPTNPQVKTLVVGLKNAFPGSQLAGRRFHHRQQSPRLLVFDWSPG